MSADPLWYQFFISLPLILQNILTLRLITFEAFPKNQRKAGFRLHKVSRKSRKIIRSIPENMWRLK